MKDRDYDFVKTSPCGRGQRHPHGLVGILWMIKDPDTIKIGNCFLKGRLKAGDLFLCVRHGGDCFQKYQFVKEYANCYSLETQWEFGSYGIGDAEAVCMTSGETHTLKTTGRLEKPS